MSEDNDIYEFAASILGAMSSAKAKIAEKPVGTSAFGHPVMIGEAVGRIVGHASNGSWGVINGKPQHSVLEIGTPHGSVITSGRMFVSEITPDGLERLKSHESILIGEGKEPYGGRLKDVIKFN